MVFEIVHHQTARKLPRCPLRVRALHLHVPMYWRMDVTSKRDLKKVAMALDDIRADCRSKTVRLTPSNERYSRMPALLEDDLSFKTNVMEDLKGMKLFNHRVTVTITVC